MSASYDRMIMKAARQVKIKVIIFRLFDFVISRSALADTKQSKIKF